MHKPPTRAKLFSGSSGKLSQYAPHVHLWDSDALLHKLNSTQAQLTLAQTQVSDPLRRLVTSNSILETTLSELGRAHGGKSRSDDLEGWRDELSGELKLAVGPHKLPPWASRPT